MEIPIYIDDASAGTLRIETGVSEVRLSAELLDPGRVVRLTVYGDKTYYLGVPEPGEGGLFLRKSLPSAQAAQFPRRPEYCAEAPRRARQSRRVLWFGGRPNYF